MDEATYFWELHHASSHVARLLISVFILEVSNDIQKWIDVIIVVLCCYCPGWLFMSVKLRLLFNVYVSAVRVVRVSLVRVRTCSVCSMSFLSACSCLHACTCTFRVWMSYRFLYIWAQLIMRVWIHKLLNHELWHFAITEKRRTMSEDVITRLFRNRLCERIFSSRKVLLDVERLENTGSEI